MNDDRPIHRPAAPDAPIPGRHWFGACDPDHPVVDENGRCTGCGETACPDCGYGDYPGYGCACGKPVQLAADLAEHRSMTLDEASAAIGRARRLRGDLLDELLPFADADTKERLRESVDTVIRARPDVSRETVELAVAKAWTGTLSCQKSLVRGELRLLWDRVVLQLERILRR